MSSLTLTQTAEKPITVTTEEAISSFADSRQGRLALSLRRPNPITLLPEAWECAANGCCRLKWAGQELQYVNVSLSPDERRRPAPCALKDALKRLKRRLTLPNLSGDGAALESHCDPL